MLGRYRTQGNKQYLFEHVQLRITTNQKMREKEKQDDGERAECFSSQNRDEQIYFQTHLNSNSKR